MQQVTPRGQGSTSVKKICSTRTLQCQGPSNEQRIPETQLVQCELSSMKESKLMSWTFEMSAKLHGNMKVGITIHCCRCGANPLKWRRLLMSFKRQKTSWKPVKFWLKLIEQVKACTYSGSFSSFLSTLYMCRPENRNFAICSRPCLRHSQAASMTIAHHLYKWSDDLWS